MSWFYSNDKRLEIEFNFWLRIHTVYFLSIIKIFFLELTVRKGLRTSAMQYVLIQNIFLANLLLRVYMTTVTVDARTYNHTAWRHANSATDLTRSDSVQLRTDLI